MNKPFIRTLMAVAILIMLTMLVMPKLIGLDLRASTVDRVIALIPPESRQQLEIKETHFDSGWFSTYGEFEITFSPSLPSMDSALNMNIALDFNHGPILFTNDGPKLGLAYAKIEPSFNSVEIAEVLDAVTFELPPVDLSLQAGFNQSLLLKLTIPDFELEQDEIKVNLDGMNIILLANRDQSAELQLSMGALSAFDSDNAAGFDLDSVEIRSKSSQIDNLLSPSESVLTLFGLSSSSPLPFAVSEVTYLTSLGFSTAAEEHFKITQQLQLADLNSELPVSSLDWKLEIDEIPDDLARTGLTLLDFLQEEMGSAGLIDGTLKGLNQQMATLVLQNPLLINNSVNASAYDGEHSLDIMARWAGLPRASDINSLSLDEIITALELEVNMELNDAAIESSPFAGLVDAYEQQGLIRLDNDRILMELSLIDNELILNGNSTSLQSILSGSN
ncbi:MAG: DUF945 family protein [Gammaproteobacteria bacterium]|nr:DUF945 family protein [Gammaproteobacteria bacterium]